MAPEPFGRPPLALRGQVSRMPAGRILRRLAGLTALAMALAGCVFAPPRLAPTLATSEATAQFTTVPANRAWINIPSALLVIQRSLAGSMEQRISLPNTSTVQGDNSVLLRARSPDGAGAGRLAFGEVLTRAGGAPSPFATLKSGELMMGEDGLGPYFWAEKRSGNNTICVLALRRVTSGMRQLPRNYSVLDIMMRNCVNGPLDAALAPIMSTHIGFAYGVSDDATSGKSRMLSPLAGPTP